MPAEEDDGHKNCGVDNSSDELELDSSGLSRGLLVDGQCLTNTRLLSDWPIVSLFRTQNIVLKITKN